MKRYLSGSLLCCLLCWAVTGMAAIDMSIQHEPLHANESFILVYESDEMDVDDPDLTPLQQDFDVLGSARSSRIVLTDPNQARGQHWSIQFVPKHSRWEIQLMPKRSGEITIPALTFGQLESPERTVTINEPTSGDSKYDDVVFVEMEADTNTSYEGAQIILELRLYRAMDTFNSSLSKPEFANGAAVVEQLSERTYRVRRNQRSYQVLERRYALFPQGSGDLQIKPTVFRGEINTGRMFVNPMGPDARHGQQRSSAKIIMRESADITIDVRPALTTSNWLPAANVTLEEEWSEEPPEFSVGQPITRTLQITARAQTASQLPSLVQSLPDSVKTYPEQPYLDTERAEDGVLGKRMERLALIPQQAGELTLPAIKIPWFNIHTGKMQEAELPARTVMVLPGRATASAQASEAGPASGVVAPAMADEPVSRSTIWPWLTVLFAGAWLLTLFLWWQQRNAKTAAHGFRLSQWLLTRQARLMSVKTACLANDAAATRRALLDWANHNLGESLNLQQLGQRYPELVPELNRLEQTLYGSTGNAWTGASLWPLIEAIDASHTVGNNSTAAEVMPLTSLSPLAKDTHN
ncbi:MAG: BatD family protein [Gammaproteobacteria bacterium]